MSATEKKSAAKKKSAVAKRGLPRPREVNQMSAVSMMSDDAKGHTIDKKTPMDFLWAASSVGRA